MLLQGIHVNQICYFKGSVLIKQIGFLEKLVIARTALIKDLLIKDLLYLELLKATNRTNSKYVHMYLKNENLHIKKQLCTQL